MNKTNKILLSFFLILMSGLGFSQSVPSYVPTNGLVGWWGFNGNAQDNSGNGNHGTVNGGTTLSSDRFGAINGSYFLDGGDCDFARGIVLPTIINNTSDFSISFWAISLTNKSNQTLFVSTPHNYLGIGYNHPFSPGNINSLIGDGVTWVIGGWGTSNFWNPTNMGDWNNITVVKSSNTYYYYQNGALMRTQTFSSGLNTGSFSLNFGTINFHGGGWCYENFSGKLDDIGIWNRALTQQEITNLY
ncbi:MAG: hypothetical protein KGQ39_06560, partial [Bacteroidetes bacterium]|nr:hypothetical protein [Bacteroidota bacterium]